jgi:uncharacterized UBP type Zn finger protein
MPIACTHTDLIEDGIQSSAAGCEDCLATNGTWVHLRLCLTCGRVGCCDDSPRRHARDHAARTGHVVMQSFEEGEEWVYCFQDGAFWETLDEVPR